MLNKETKYLIQLEKEKFFLEKIVSDFKICDDLDECQNKNINNENINLENKNEKNINNINNLF